MATGSGEFAYIDWIRETMTFHKNVPVGIGDDAALLRLNTKGKARRYDLRKSNEAFCLLASDMLMENVHFSLDTASPAEVGRKAIAVNLSDIAAMAGKPCAVLVSIAIPKNSPASLARELHQGMKTMAEQFDVRIVGGDTNSWDGPLVVNVTVVGQPTERGTLLRSGAVPGDLIFVTGELGGSSAGKHLSFEPRIEAALELYGNFPIHSMIDISDGLIADLYHILEESDVVAALSAKDIPISEAAWELGNDRRPIQEQTIDELMVSERNGQRTPLFHALQDGEDFELLFTADAEYENRLLKESPVPLSCIGIIIQNGDLNSFSKHSAFNEKTGEELRCELYCPQGETAPLPRMGWEHSL